MISSLLHLIGLRPRVYYTLTNCRGGGARPPWPAPFKYANVAILPDKDALYNRVHGYGEGREHAHGGNW